MKSSEILSEFAYRIYEWPLASVWDTPPPFDLTDPLAVLALIVDFETERTLEGIDGFIFNSSGLHANETVAALEIIGSAFEATVLRDILKVVIAGSPEPNASEVSRPLTAEDIARFVKLDKKDYSTALNKVEQLVAQIDCQTVRDHAVAFVAQHQEAFEAALTRGRSNQSVTTPPKEVTQNKYYNYDLSCVYWNA